MSTIQVLQQSPVLQVVQQTSAVQVVQGAQGPAGPSTLFIGPDAPTPPGLPYLWIQTGLGDGSDFTIWFEDGEP